MGYPKSAIVLFQINRKEPNFFFAISGQRIQICDGDERNENIYQKMRLLKKLLNICDTNIRDVIVHSCECRTTR